MSAFAAGLKEDEDGYLWGDLSGDSLQSLCICRRQEERATMIQILLGMRVFAMSELARKAEAPADDPAIAQSAFEICGGAGVT